MGYVYSMCFVSMQTARAQGIDCIVAPYEADAQLAYLNKTGMVQAVITEDSDLLAFGCKKVGRTQSLISNKSSITVIQMYESPASSPWRHSASHLLTRIKSLLLMSKYKMQPPGNALQTILLLFQGVSEN